MTTWHLDLRAPAFCGVGASEGLVEWLDQLLVGHASTWPAHRFALEAMVRNPSEGTGTGACGRYIANNAFQQAFDPAHS